MLKIEKKNCKNVFLKRDIALFQKLSETDTGGEENVSLKNNFESNMLQASIVGCVK